MEMRNFDTNDVGLIFKHLTNYISILSKALEKIAEAKADDPYSSRIAITALNQCKELAPPETDDEPILGFSMSQVENMNQKLQEAIHILEGMIVKKSTWLKHSK
jgi:hypothetical protein